MFDKEIAFYGKHADYLRRLAPSRQYTEKSVQEQRQTFFASNIDTVLAAAVIGFIKQRKAPVENSNEIAPNNIFLQAIMNHKEELELIYRIIMLLDEKASLPVETRIDKAFKYDDDAEKRKPGDDVFWSYVRGGIEYLYENLYENSDDIQEDIRNAAGFVQSFNMTYSRENITQEILTACEQIMKPQ